MKNAVMNAIVGNFETKSFSAVPNIIINMENWVNSNKCGDILYCFIF